MAIPDRTVGQNAGVARSDPATQVTRIIQRRRITSKQKSILEEAFFLLVRSSRLGTEMEDPTKAFSSQQKLQTFSRSGLNPAIEGNIDKKPDKP